MWLLCVVRAGRARVFTGYVQVMSCSKKVVYKEGKMQAIG